MKTSYDTLSISQEAEMYIHTINRVVNHYTNCYDRPELESYLNVEFFKLLGKFDGTGCREKFFLDALHTKAKRYYMEVEQVHKDRTLSLMTQDENGNTIIYPEVEKKVNVTIESSSLSLREYDLNDDVIHILERECTVVQKRIVIEILTNDAVHIKRTGLPSVQRIGTELGIHHQTVKRELVKMSRIDGLRNLLTM